MPSPERSEVTLCEYHHHVIVKMMKVIDRYDEGVQYPLYPYQLPGSFTAWKLCDLRTDGMLLPCSYFDDILQRPKKNCYNLKYMHCVQQYSLLQVPIDG